MSDRRKTKPGAKHLAERYLHEHAPTVRPEAPTDWQEGDLPRCKFCKAGLGFRPTKEWIEEQERWIRETAEASITPPVARETHWVSIAAAGWLLAILSWLIYLS